MLALPEEYIGSMCEVKSLNNDLLAVGRVIKIDNEALEVAALPDERMPLLQYRAPVKLFVHHDKLATRILVGVAYLSTETFARLEEVKALQDFERRGAFRVNTDVVGKVTALLNDEEQQAFDAALQAAAPAEAEAMLAHTSFEVRIMDISLTGLRLQSQKTLVPGSRFYIEFSLLQRPVTLCLRIHRTIKMPNGDTQYGGIFFDFSEKQMDHLCRDLFQLQRLEKNKRRNSVFGD